MIGPTTAQNAIPIALAIAVVPLPDHLPLGLNRLPDFLGVRVPGLSTDFPVSDNRNVGDDLIPAGLDQALVAHCYLKRGAVHGVERG
jgi:hypothetical protein